jgi:undecaprenyl pyrophosphate phosphatase UppP
MSHQLTYLEAVVTGLIQGVTELFPVSSLGHNVLIPALIGGSWASSLNVSAPNSPYLAFIVGLHVATAIAMIAYFWRDWLRIVGGFLTSLRTRSITTPDQRLAWMIILATIPVGIVGAALQHEVTKVLAKPELAATFLAINGVILLGSERMRRRARGAADVGAGGPAVPVAAGGPAVAPDGTGWGGGPVAAGNPGWGGQPGAPGGPGGPGGPPGGWAPGGRPGPGGPGPEGYSQQPWQQQWQGPDPRYGQDGNPQYPGGQYPGNGPQGRDEEYGRRQRPPYGPPPSGQPQHGQPQYGADPRGGQPGQGWPPSGDPRGGYDQGDPRGGYDPRDPRNPQSGHDPQNPQGGGYDPRDPRNSQGGYDPRDPRSGHDPRDQRRTAGRHGHAAGGGAHGGHGGGHAAGAGRRAAAGVGDPAVAADQRLSTMGYKRAVLVGSAQILALLPGISRDGIVTVTGMWRGMSRQDAVRFSFLLSAPVILAAGALKAKDLAGPMSAGIHGPILVGSIVSGVGAYLSIRFLTKYFSEEKSLSPFGVYCLIAGLGSLAYLVLK